jgi:hypothetical protein
MKDPHELRAPSQQPSGSTSWDGAPDAIIAKRLERISQELRQILLAACCAASMDGFLFVAALIPANIDKDGYAYIDETRQGTGFTNLDHGSDPISLLLYAVERLKRRR